MHDPTGEQRWAVRAAYRKGREVRLVSYERLLQSVLQTLEAAKCLMQIDDLTEELRDVARAMIALEDAWTALSLKTSASLARADGQLPCQPEGERDGGDGQ